MAHTKIPFLEVFSDETKNGTKLKTCEYLISGIHPIIDQGQDFIAGYTNAEDGLYTNVPVIIFGDHTRVLKYVDFPFFLGADGAKILKPLSTQANYKYLYYALKCVRIPDTGYNRHFKWLKEAKITIPDIQKQTDIVATLDAVARILTLRRAQLAKLDELVKCRFIELFGDCRKNPKQWKTKKLEEIASVGSSKRVFVEELTNEGIPFYRGTEVGALAEGQNVTPELFISDSHYRSLCEASGRPVMGDLLMPSICPDGRIWMVNSDSPFYFKDGRVLWIHDIREQFNPVFLQYTLKDRIITDYASIASGTTFAELKIFTLKSCKIFDVPLSLQTAFADFVRRIDKSRFVVKEGEKAVKTLKRLGMGVNEIDRAGKIW